MLLSLLCSQMGTSQQCIWNAEVDRSVLTGAFHVHIGEPYCVLHATFWQRALPLPLWSCRLALQGAAALQMLMVGHAVCVSSQI